MKLDNLEEKEAPLLSRKEISATIEHKGATPSRATIREAIAVRAKTKKELVIIRNIKTIYGETKSKITAHVYPDEKSMKLYEPGFSLKKHEEKKKEETTAE